MAASAQYAHDVGLLHDQQFLAVELDLGARPLAEQHPVADLDVDRNQLAALVAPARADRSDFALRRLFLGGVRNDVPLDFSSASKRLTTTRSCSGRNLDLDMTFPFAGSLFRYGWLSKADRAG